MSASPETQTETIAALAAGVGPGRPVWAVGLMSGTSMDGVDVALVRTDGETITEVGPSLTLAYNDGLRTSLQALVRGEGDEALVVAVERELTERHWMAVGALVARWPGDPRSIAVIGFHGHTLWHRPEEHRTRQIGDGGLLAELSGVTVVNDFRTADMEAGGEGAPFAPLYHLARVEASGFDLPVAVLNVGGVANVTWIGPRDMALEDRVLAFDTGPGGALLDDWAHTCTGVPCDMDGRLAAAGQVDDAVLQHLLTHPYFDRTPPKSLDRFSFSADLNGLTPEDGAATLTAFTARAVAKGMRFFPDKPRCWLVTGGGRLNGVLMAALAEAVGTDVIPVEEVDWNGDALEAEAFAYLAVRSLRGLPLSLPKTTGARDGVTGGRLYRPEGNRSKGRAST